MTMAKTTTKTKSKSKDESNATDIVRLGLHNLHAAPFSHRERKRIGRGPGSGTGKTSGKGHKGIKARSGHHGHGGGKPRFEGGQMPLTRRLPKRGFTNPFRVESQIVRLGDANAAQGLSEVTPETLVKAGLIRAAKGPAKLLANGKLTRAVTVRGVKVSASVRAAIAAAGGRVEE
jgi:large subunit ribosomal protein L15